jgi:hypothetical protein
MLAVLGKDTYGFRLLRLRAGTPALVSTSAVALTGEAAMRLQEARMSPEPTPAALTSRGGRPRLLVWLLILSVVLRVGVAFYMGDQVPPPVNAPDETSYSYLAERLATGYGYSFDRPWYPFGKPAGHQTAHWSFLYTAFVAGIYAVFGVHPLVARLVGAVLGGALLPWMVYRLASRLFPDNTRTWLLAAASGAIYAYFIIYAAMLMTETFFIIAVLFTLERALALAERPDAKRAIALGLGLGVAALLRQSILPWVVVLFGWLLWVAFRKEALRSTIAPLAISGLILMGMILPFTVRNYVVYHDFLLLNSNAGYAMYSAQHPLHGTRFQEYAAAPVPSSLQAQDLSEPELDRELLRLGIEQIVADPWRYVLLSLSRVRAYFVFWPTSESSVLYNVGRLVSFTLFLPFMLLGAGLSMRREAPLRTRADWARFSTTPVAMVLLFVSFYSLLHILTWAMTRYRLPVDAVMLVFAALAIDECVLRRVEGWLEAAGGRAARQDE